MCCRKMKKIPEKTFIAIPKYDIIIEICQPGEMENSGPPKCDYKVWRKPNRPLSIQKRKGTKEMEKTAFLLLENGTLIEGKSFGAVKEAIGEIVFNTGMVGYLNTLTDPCYCGQIVMQTFPLIGNYGVIPEEIEGAVPFLSAYIVRDWCQEPSNFRCRGQIDAFLKKHGIVCEMG